MLPRASSQMSKTVLLWAESFSGAGGRMSKHVNESRISSYRYSPPWVVPIQMVPILSSWMQYTLSVARLSRLGAS